MLLLKLVLELLTSDSLQLVANMNFTVLHIFCICILLVYEEVSAISGDVMLILNVHYVEFKWLKLFFCGA